jgi:hypothetical protein
MNLLKVKLDLELHGRPTKEKRQRVAHGGEGFFVQAPGRKIRERKLKRKRSSEEPLPKRGRARTWWPDG